MRRFRIELVSCASNSSAHGIPRIVSADRASLRTLWLLIYGTATLALLVHFSMLLHLFLQNTVTTSISYEAIPFEFPDVTVCAGSIYSVRLIEKFFRNKVEQEYASAGLDNDTLLAMAANFTEDEFREHEDHFRLDLEQSILFCEYYGEQCDYARFTTMKYRRREMCHTYHPENRRTSPDIELGLALAVYAENVDNEFSLRLKTLGIPGTAYAGVRLVIHEPGCCPHASSEALAVSTGSTTEVILKIEQINRLPVPKHDMTRCASHQQSPVKYCADLDEPDTELTFNATTRDCQIRRMQEIILERCNCVSDQYPVPMDICSLRNESGLLSTGYCSDYSCVRDQLAQVGRSYEQLVTKYCPNTCEQTTWYPKLGASIKWESTDIVELFQHYIREAHGRLLQDNHSASPFDKFIDASPISCDSFTRDFVELIIYPATHAGNKIVEKLAYPLESFISEVGGILGLWIGSSVITFLEPLELICKMIEGIVSDYLNRKKRQDGVRDDDAAGGVRHLRQGNCSYTTVTLYATTPSGESCALTQCELERNV